MIAPNPRLRARHALPGAEVSAADGFHLERHKGSGPFHFLLVPGLVPDGRETFLRQRPLFLGRGDASVVTWPYGAFDLEAVMRGVERFVEEALAERRKPVLVGVSVGGGVVLEYLRRRREAGSPPAIAATILLSPLSSVDDLSSVLKRLWTPIVADSGDPAKALEKGRGFFRQLASKSGGRTAKNALTSLLGMLTPGGLEEIADAPIRKRIETTLSLIPPSGAIERCKALRGFAGLEAGERVRDGLSDAPTLILWGSKERHTLDMEGPGSSVLCRPDLAERHFKAVEVHWIYTKKGEPVPHASLLKHHKAYAKPLRRFLKRL